MFHTEMGRWEEIIHFVGILRRRRRRRRRVMRRRFIINARAKVHTILLEPCVLRRGERVLNIFFFWCCLINYNIGARATARAYFTERVLNDTVVERDTACLCLSIISYDHYYSPQRVPGSSGAPQSNVSRPLSASLVLGTRLVVRAALL